MIKKLLCFFLAFALVSTLTVLAENPEGSASEYTFQISTDEAADINTDVNTESQPHEAPATGEGFHQNRPDGSKPPEMPTTENGGAQGKRKNGPGQDVMFSPDDFGQGMPPSGFQQGEFDRGGFQPGGFFGEQGGMREKQGTDIVTQQTKGIMDYLTEYSTAITAMVLLALAFVFVIFYKRKHY